MDSHFGRYDTEETTDGVKENGEKVLVRDRDELCDTGRRNIELILDAKRDDYRDKGYDEATIEQMLKKDEQGLWEEFYRDAFGTEYEESAAEKADEPVTVDSEALANGETDVNIFRRDGSVERFKEGVHIEELTKEEYETLKEINPKAASVLMTEYIDRTVPEDDINELSRDLWLDNRNDYEVVDMKPEKDRARVRDMATGEEYEVYPNPMLTVNHMDGRQGQNDIGMQEDCGIASAAKGINDLYGKRVTSENRLAEYAYRTGNCDTKHVKLTETGEYDYSNCGGTHERNVKEFYEANGLSAEAYTFFDIPTPEEIGEEIKDGAVASVAVNHDLFWNYEDAQSFDESMVDEARYSRDKDYRDYIDALVKMKEGSGVFAADHFVNISNVVYDEDGTLKGFIVADTGTGEVKMVDKEDLRRAYQGTGRIRVSAKGCVIARRKRDE